MLYTLCCNCFVNTHPAPSVYYLLSASTVMHGPHLMVPLLMCSRQWCCSCTCRNGCLVARLTCRLVCSCVLRETVGWCSLFAGLLCTCWGTSCTLGPGLLRKCCRHACCATGTTWCPCLCIFIKLYVGPACTNTSLLQMVCIVSGASTCAPAWDDVRNTYCLACVEVRQMQRRYTVIIPVCRHQYFFGLVVTTREGLIRMLQHKGMKYLPDVGALARPP